MAPAFSLSRCLVVRRAVRLFAGLRGDRAAALGLNLRARGGVFATWEFVKICGKRGHDFRFFQILCRPRSVFPKGFAGFAEKLPPAKKLSIAALW